MLVFEELPNGAKVSVEVGMKGFCWLGFVLLLSAW